jgi:hypothetical protein
MAIPVSIPQEFTIFAGELLGISRIPEDSLRNQWRTMKNSMDPKKCGGCHELNFWTASEKPACEALKCNSS